MLEKNLLETIETIFRNRNIIGPLCPFFLNICSQYYNISGSIGSDKIQECYLLFLTTIETRTIVVCSLRNAMIQLKCYRHVHPFSSLSPVNKPDKNSIVGRTE